MSLERLQDPDTGELLHMIIRGDKAAEGVDRVELIPPENFLQGAIISGNAGKRFAAHFHLRRSRSFSDLIAQEAWVVIRGRVRVTYFGLDNKEIATREIGPGDCSITLSGGHGYEILEGPAQIFEFKSGPYEGQIIDKEFISPA